MTGDGRAMGALDRERLLVLANGIATGRAVADIAADIGLNRIALGRLVTREDVLDAAAKAIGAPDRIDCIALFSNCRLNGERTRMMDVRMRLAEKLRTMYADHFTAEREAEAAKRKADIEAAEADWKIAEAKREAELECLDADLTNLETHCMLMDRDWADGTDAELARGLDTPSARRKWRCAHGLRWTCAGFGVYFSPRWSAARCRWRYDADRLSDEEYERVMEEIEAEEMHGEAYRQCPLDAPRDAALPVTKAGAMELYERVKSGGGLKAASTKTATTKTAKRTTSTKRVASTKTATTKAASTKATTTKAASTKRTASTKAAKRTRSGGKHKRR